MWCPVYKKQCRALARRTIYHQIGGTPLYYPSGVRYVGRRVVIDYIGKCACCGMWHLDYRHARGLYRRKMPRPKAYFTD